MAQMTRRSMLRYATAASIGATATLGTRASASADGAPAPARPITLLAHDGSGDFGPQTPGTKTAGWQEALDFCVAEGRDLYVQGGAARREPSHRNDNVYFVSQTITIPAAQDFRIDGGDYVVAFTGPPDQDAVVIDSAMNCRYKLGIISGSSGAACIRVQPQNPVPLDGFPVVTETIIQIDGPVGGQSAFVIDGTHAPVLANKFHHASCLASSNVCVLMVGTVLMNEIEVLHLHTGVNDTTLLRMEKNANANRIYLGQVQADPGTSGVTGIDLAGSNNHFEISGTPGLLAPRRTIVLEATASGNQINILGGSIDLPNPPPLQPAKFVTDLATTPTNQISYTGYAAPANSISVPRGGFAYTQRLVPATVWLDRPSPDVRITLARGTQSADIGQAPASGQPITLSVGDRIQVVSPRSDRLHVLPLRTM